MGVCIEGVELEELGGGGGGGGAHWINSWCGVLLLVYESINGVTR